MTMGEVIYQTANKGITLATTTTLSLVDVHVYDMTNNGGQEGGPDVRTASGLQYWSIGLNITRYCNHGEEAKDKDGGDLQGTEEHDPWRAGMIDDEPGI